VRFDVRGVDHLRVSRPSTPGQLPEQVLPKTPTRPPHKPVIDCRRRTILGRAITPAASAPENMHDPADDPTIIDPIHTANVGRQMRLDPSPLLVAQPKQIPAHDPDPFRKRIRIVWNQRCLASAPQLMSSDPSTIRLDAFWPWGPPPHRGLKQLTARIVHRLHGKRGRGGCAVAKRSQISPQCQASTTSSQGGFADVARYSSTHSVRGEATTAASLKGPKQLTARMSPSILRT